MFTLHLYSEGQVSAFASALTTNQYEKFATQGIREIFGNLPAATTTELNQISAAFVRSLGDEHPIFTNKSFTLTSWEAMVDRGVGMLLRPPARLLADAGIDSRSLLRMPIRLEPHGGIMAGAAVPARLMPDLLALFDQRLERSARRLADAGEDPLVAIGFVTAAAHYAKSKELGLIEAQFIYDEEMLSSLRTVTLDQTSLDSESISRIRLALNPPKPPGKLSRLFRRPRV